MELKKCEPIIEEIVYVTHPRNKREREDVKQNLWLMILQFIKDNREQLNALGSDKERIGFIKASVKKAFDYTNNWNNRHTIPTVSLSSIDTAALSDDSCDLDESIFGSELQEILDEWVVSKNGSTKRFVQECIYPSKEVLDMWYKLMESYPRYKHFQDIPPQTLAIRILGVEIGKYRRIIRTLSYFLSNKGYGESKWEIVKE